MFQAFLPSRWAFGLARLHNHIVAHLQMLYQVVLGDIGCITPINPTSPLSTIPCPNGHPLWKLGEGQSHLKPKEQKQ